MMAESLHGLHSMLLLDQHDRWQNGDRPRVENYLQLIPELGSDRGRLLDVIYQEVVLRDAAGEKPSLDEYIERFPALKEELRLQFEVHSGVDWGNLPSLTDEHEQSQPNIDGYHIESELGRGTYGTVYKAWEVSLKRFVAIKLLASSGVDPTDEAEQSTEAQSIARLTHPNIVQVYSVGKCAAGNYFSQELVEGGTLSAFLQGRPQDPRAAAQWVATLADAVHYAHLCRVIHCDLKPANILLRRSSEQCDDNGPPSLADFQPKISDFGLARSLDTEQLVQRHHVTGTLHYMSPEQTGIEDAPIGPASDVYSIGAILYELLTGRPPFAGDSKLAAFLKIRRELPPHPRNILRTVPDDLNAICMKCLAKVPMHRYASATALADDLRRYHSGLSPKAVTVGFYGKLVRWAKRKPAVAGLSLALLLTSLVSFGIITAKMLEAQASERRAHQRADELDASLYRNQFRLTWMAWEAGDVARAQRILVQTNPSRRSFEWYYLNSLLGATSKGVASSSHDITYLAASQDGRWLAVCDTVDAILLVDRTNRERPHKLMVSQVPATPIMFSSDSTRIAAATIEDDQQWVRLWDVSSGKAIQRFGPLGGTPVAFTFSEENNQLVTVGWVDSRHLPSATTVNWGDSLDLANEPIFGNSLRLVSHANRIVIETWDVPSGERIGGIVGPNIKQSFSPKCSLAPGGKLLAWTPSTELMPGSSGRHEARIVDATDGTELFTLREHSKHLHGLTFSPDAKLLATYGEDGECILWNTTTGKAMRRLTGHDDAILTADFSRDGNWLATAGRDFIIRIWNVADGDEIKLLRGATASLRSVAFADDGQTLFSGDVQGSLLEWSLTGQSAIRLKVEPAVTRMSFDERGEHLLVSQVNGILSVLRLEDLMSDASKAKRRVVADDSLEFSLPLSGMQIATVGARDGQVRLGQWSDLPVNGERPLKLASLDQSHKATANGDSPICWAPDGTEFAYIGKDSKVIRLIDARNRRLRMELLVDSGIIRSIACGETDRLAATGDDRRVRIWNRKSGKLIQEIPTKYPATRLAFRPAGQDLATVGEQQSECAVWHCASGKLRFTLEGHRLPITCLAYTTDGLRIITGGEDRTIRVWDAESGEELLTINHIGDDVRHLAISRDGRCLAISDGTDLIRSTISVYGKNVRSFIPSR